MSLSLMFLAMSFCGIGIPLLMAQIYLAVAKATDDRDWAKSLPKGAQQEALREA
jgi:hypothetical protein